MIKDLLLMSLNGIQDPFLFKAESFVVDLKTNPSKQTKAFLDHTDLNELVSDGLPPASWRIYLYLYGKADQRHIPTIQEISNDLKLSERTVQPSRKALVDKGYVFDMKSSSNAVATHICFLGKTQVKLARIRAAAAEIIKDNQISDPVVWAKENFGEFEQMIKSHKLLEIYDKDEL